MTIRLTDKHATIVIPTDREKKDSLSDNSIMILKCIKTTLMIKNAILKKHIFMKSVIRFRGVKLFLISVNRVFGLESGKF